MCYLDSAYNYFFAVFIASGVYQIGEDQARFWIVGGTVNSG